MFFGKIKNSSLEDLFVYENDSFHFKNITCNDVFLIKKIGNFLIDKDNQTIISKDETSDNSSLKLTNNLAATLYNSDETTSFNKITGSFSVNNIQCNSSFSISCNNISQRGINPFICDSECSINNLSIYNLDEDHIKFIGPVSNYSFQTDKNKVYFIHIFYTWMAVYSDFTNYGKTEIYKTTSGSFWKRGMFCGRFFPVNWTKEETAFDDGIGQIKTELSIKYENGYINSKASISGRYSSWYPYEDINDKTFSQSPVKLNGSAKIYISEFAPFIVPDDIPILSIELIGNTCGGYSGYVKYSIDNSSYIQFGTETNINRNNTYEETMEIEGKTITFSAYMGASIAWTINGTVIAASKYEYVPSSSGYVYTTSTATVTLIPGESITISKIA